MIHIILFNFEKYQKICRKAESVRKTVTSTCKLLPGKQRTLYAHVVLNGVICPQIYMISFYMHDTFYSSSFLPSVTLIKYVSSYRKM